jgi:hypothetical protein
MTEREPTKLTCDECRGRLEGYLRHTLSPSETRETQYHLSWCDACRKAAFDRAVERVDIGEVLLREPPYSVWQRVAARVRGILALERFPEFYVFRPAVAAAVTELPRIHATPDNQFIVELAALPPQPLEQEPTLEIAVRAHSVALRGSPIRYRIFEAEADQPCRLGEATLDNEGLALVYVSLPRTDRGPYRFEVEALHKSGQHRE